ncbi:hypothetical protein JW979_02355 [bacterium]|nr:hypothetical protein [candidate division CSSED10-310 bacterium]
MLPDSIVGEVNKSYTLTDRYDFCRSNNYKVTFEVLRTDSDVQPSKEITEMSGSGFALTCMVNEKTKIRISYEFIVKQFTTSDEKVVDSRQFCKVIMN